MNEQDIKTIIYQILKKIAPDTNPEELGGDENIREALDIDYFDFLQFIIGLDKKIGLQTKEKDYGKITTLNSLLNYIQSKKE